MKNKTPPTVSLADVSMHDDQLFIDAWRVMESNGFMYGEDALENVHLGWKLAWQLAQAASPAHTPAPDTRLPEGMVRWEGGDAAPADWDGGPVQWTDCIAGAGPKHFGWQNQTGIRIIAYTPHPAVEVTEKRAREVLAKVLAEHVGHWSSQAEAIRQDDQTYIRDDIAIRAMLAFAASASTTEDGV